MQNVKKNVKSLYLPSDPRQCLQQTTETKKEVERIPTGRRQTSWLFTSAVEDLNSGRATVKQIQLADRALLELGTAGLRIGRVDYSLTMPPLLSIRCDRVDPEDAFPEERFFPLGNGTNISSSIKRFSKIVQSFEFPR